MQHSSVSTLGHFLRTRRRRITPEDAGLATGGRRYAPGLRRDEVAVLANVSTSWYTSLERGRRGTASPGVLDSLAGVLRLTATERRYLHELVARDRHRDPPEIDGVTAALLRRLIEHTEPVGLPAYAINDSGDLLCWNRHMDQWYGEFPGADQRHRNMLWWMFTSVQARQRIVGWEREARAMTACARYAMGMNGTSRGLRDAVGDLRGASAQFASWWEAHEVADRSPATRTFDRPGFGVTTLQLLAVRPAAAPTALIVLHLTP